jgi:hypothetical protein
MRPLVDLRRNNRAHGRIVGVIGRLLQLEDAIGAGPGRSGVNCHRLKNYRLSKDPPIRL